MSEYPAAYWMLKCKEATERAERAEAEADALEQAVSELRYKLEQAKAQRDALRKALERIVEGRPNQAYDIAREALSHEQE